MKIKSTSDRVRIKKINYFLEDAVNDYIASRTLFLAQLPVQASILSSTAIEKLIKAILALNGNECKGHLKKAHRQALKNFDQEGYKRLSEDFLELNQKVYKMRYLEVLPVGFNVVIATREFLTELDYTFISLFKNISFSNKTGLFEGTSLFSMINSKDERLLKDNYMFQDIDKETFIYNHFQFIYEMRIMKDKEPIKMQYWSERRPKREGYLRESLIIVDKKDLGVTSLNIDMAFYPMEPIK